MSMLSILPVLLRLVSLNIKCDRISSFALSSLIPALKRQSSSELSVEI